MRKKKRKLRLHLSALPAPNATVARVHAISVTAKAGVVSRAVKVRSKRVHLVPNKPSLHWQSAQSMPPQPRKRKAKSAASVAVVVADGIVASGLSVLNVSRSKRSWKRQPMRSRPKCLHKRLQLVQSVQSAVNGLSVQTASKVVTAVEEIVAIVHPERLQLHPRPWRRPQIRLKKRHMNLS